MIPDALKPAICPTCHGRGHIGCNVCLDPDYTPARDGHAPANEPCPTCGGSGINPDMIKVSSGAGRFAGIGEYIPEGRYVVIPLEDTQ